MEDLTSVDYLQSIEQSLSDTNESKSIVKKFILNPLIFDKSKFDIRKYNI